MMEIEKKYLVKEIPFNVREFKKIEIQQGYISIDPVIRIRKSNSDFYLTVKGPGKMIREEYELPITDKQFEKLKSKVETNIIKKNRYLIPIDGNTVAELDIYKGILEGLIVVEVEFSRECDANNFIPPVWFGEDVTLNEQYQNNMLAKIVKFEPNTILKFSPLSTN